MTEKRFTINGKEIIQDKQVWCMANSEHCADVIATAMNKLHEENDELRMDNDIKFWKHECIRETNTNSIFTFELGKAIDEGYVVSEKFKQMMEEWKKEAEKMKEKHKRLFE